VGAEIPVGVSSRTVLLFFRLSSRCRVERLGLTKAEYVSSAALKRWCEHNRNRFYVPEWLLGAWRMEVEFIFSGVA
jgi:hypothetical protein